VSNRAPPDPPRPPPDALGAVAAGPAVLLVMGVLTVQTIQDVGDLCLACATCQSLYWAVQPATKMQLDGTALTCTVSHWGVCSSRTENWDVAFVRSSDMIILRHGSRVSGALVAPYGLIPTLILVAIFELILIKL